MKHTFPEAIYIDLLLADIYGKYALDLTLLRKECAAFTEKKIIIIDEIQKLPELLNEVHWLMENTFHRFILSGSSARKLKRGNANLLGGRALFYEMFGITSQEMEGSFDLIQILNHGNLPKHLLSAQYKKMLNTYISVYLKEEIMEEGLSRNLPAFGDFLRVSAISDTEITNYSNIASDCGVSVNTAKGYFQILEDTLLGRSLSAFVRREKRKVIHAPKFYFKNVGLVNLLAKRGEIQEGGELFGKAFENFIFHELCAYSHYSNSEWNLSYWRLSSGVEVDFIINDAEYAIEAKGVKRVTNEHLKGVRLFKADFPKTKKIMLVTLVGITYKTDDNVWVYSLLDFLKMLWSHKLF